jgi:cytochrome P450
MSDTGIFGGQTDPKDLAHPQPLFKMLREVGPIVDMAEMGMDVPNEDGTENLAGHMIIVGNDDDVRHVLSHPETFSSGVDAVAIGQVRPLIPLQIDPPAHKHYRKLLDPIFAPRQVALLEDQTRELVRGLIEPLVERGRCNFHDEVSEPLPTTVFLNLLGLPLSRAKEFIELKDGIIRPPVKTRDERVAYTDVVGQKIYTALQKAIDERNEERGDDFISMFLDAEVDGQRLTNDDVLDIGYVFFLAGLDTVTATLDCMVSYLAQHPDQRKRLVDDPALIPRAAEEMLRWETPVQAVIRVTTEPTEIRGCPIDEGRVVAVMLASANTDDGVWDDHDTIDFDRAQNRHLAFGGGAHRCLGSHLARMELRVALEEWHRVVPDYCLVEGIELAYSQGLRSVDNLELVW